MFELAVKARIPIIGVTTDDPVNLVAVLQHYSGLNVRKFSGTLGPYLFWTDDTTKVTTDLWEKLVNQDHQLVVVNGEPHPLVFDTGILPTPEPLVVELLSELQVPDHQLLLPVLKGLSLKSISEVVALTQARTGSANPLEIRRTRSSIYGVVQGLFPTDTSYDFYLFPPELKSWLEVNKDYFLKPTHHKLVPKGILLEGTPGVGKSMGAKAVANFLGVPLFRLDIATTLDKFIGVSEARIAKTLALVDREEPCVLLLDEVEKIFSQTEDSGVTTRILSQLLWWLQEHQSRVLTVMTTNHIEKLPPELYRSERIDFKMKVKRLDSFEARNFAQYVYRSVAGGNPGLKIVQLIATALTETGGEDWSHSEVSDLVITTIKKHKLL